MLRHHPHDSPQLRQKAHVEQAVGLVDNDDFNLVELDYAALDEIDKPSGTRNEHLRTLSNMIDLMTLGLAAHDCCTADMRVACDQIELARGLRRELASRQD